MVLADRHSYYPFVSSNIIAQFVFVCNDVVVEFYKLFVVAMGGVNKKKIKPNMQHHYSDHP